MRKKGCVWVKGRQYLSHDAPASSESMRPRAEIKKRMWVGGTARPHRIDPKGRSDTERGRGVGTARTSLPLARLPQDLPIPLSPIRRWRSVGVPQSKKCDVAAAQGSSLFFPSFKPTHTHAPHRLLRCSGTCAGALCLVLVGLGGDKRKKVL